MKVTITNQSLHAQVLEATLARLEGEVAAQADGRKLEKFRASFFRHRIFHEIREKARMSFAYRSIIKHQSRKIQELLRRLLEQMDTTDDGMAWCITVDKKHPMFFFEISAPALELLITNLYVQKILADVEDDKVGEARQTMFEFVYDFFLFRFGLRHVSETLLWCLYNAVRAHADDNFKIRRFGRMCGILDAKVRKEFAPFPSLATDLYLQLMSRAVAKNMTKSSKSSAVGLPESAFVDGGIPTLSGDLLDVLPELVSDKVLDLMRSKMELSTFVETDLDDLLGDLLTIWLKNYSEQGNHLAEMFVEGDSNSDGVLSPKEFTDLCHQVDPNLPDAQIKKMFKSALTKSGKSGNKMTAAAFAQTMREFNVLGYGSLKSMKHASASLAGLASAKFMDFPMAGEVWGALSPLVVQAIAENRTRGAANDAELAALKELESMMSGLEGMMSIRKDPSAVWKLLRRIIVSWTNVRQRLEAAAIEDRRDEQGFSAFTTSFK